MNFPRAILFDLDGTLTDRRRSVIRFADRFHAVFRRRLRPLAKRAMRETIVRADGAGARPRRELLAELLRELRWTERPRIDRLESFWNATFASCTVAGRGLLATMSRLRRMGVRIGLVTNGGTRAQLRKIELLGIGPLLDCVLISQSAGLCKSDRRIFALAIERLGVRATDVWFVGDDPIVDVGGARAAGLTAVWMKSSRAWPPSVPRPAFEIARLSELVRVIRELKRSPTRLSRGVSLATRSG